MKVFEIGTGYTSIPAQVGAATEIVVEELTRSMMTIDGIEPYIIDIKDKNRTKSNLPINEVFMPQFFSSTDTSLGIVHKLKRVLYSISLAFKLRKILKSSKDEIVLHFHNQYNFFFFNKFVSRKLKQRCKTIYTVHSYIWFEDWEKISDIVKKRYFQEVYSIRNADKVFVLNNTTSDHFIKRLNVNSDKIVKIPNGVNTNVYYPLPAEYAEKVRQRLELTDKRIFLHVGSVCARKNQLGGLKMMLPILKHNEDCVYAYAGGLIDQEYKSQIDSFASVNGIESQVLYLGEVAPGKVLNEYYNISQCLLFSSVSEAFGLVIIEALSCGIPVLLDDNIELELSQDIKEGIIMYSQKKFNSIIEAEVLDTERCMMHGVGGRRVIEERYSWDAVVKEYVEKIVQ